MGNRRAQSAHDTVVVALERMAMGQPHLEAGRRFLGAMALVGEGREGRRVHLHGYEGFV